MRNMNQEGDPINFKKLGRKARKESEKKNHKISNHHAKIQESEKKAQI